MTIRDNNGINNLIILHRIAHQQIFHVTGCSSINGHDANHGCYLQLLRMVLLILGNKLFKSLSIHTVENGKTYLTRTKPKTMLKLETNTHNEHQEQVPQTEYS